MTTKATSTEIQVVQIKQERITLRVIGTSPIIFNNVSLKAKRELLSPRGRRNDADRAQNLKHNPYEEFRASIYRDSDESAPTLLRFPAPGFKGAMATAALDLPGTKKSEIGRLCWVEGTHVSIYGVPKLLMSVVRSADMNHTPDIRSRAIVERWGAEVSISFVKPKLSDITLTRLLAAAGVTAGVGDFRQEKGKGSFGQFAPIGDSDAEVFAAIQASGGRGAQLQAMSDAIAYDDETEELLHWWKNEYSQKYGKVAE